MKVLDCYCKSPDGGQPVLIWTKARPARTGYNLSGKWTNFTRLLTCWLLLWITSLSPPPARRDWRRNPVFNCKHRDHRQGYRVSVSCSNTHWDLILQCPQHAHIHWWECYTVRLRHHTISWSVDKMFLLRQTGVPSTPVQCVQQYSLTVVQHHHIIVRISVCQTKLPFYRYMRS